MPGGARTTVMDQQIFRFLGCAARPECEPRHLRLLAEEADRLSLSLREWNEVPALAEAHGIAPLLYSHLKDAGVEPPLNIRRELAGLYLRHRESNRVNFTVLSKILTALESADIPVLVLKGAALAHLIYPEPGLRPISDLDLLVPRAAAPRVQKILGALGFLVPSTFVPGRIFSPKHMAPAIVQMDGFSVVAEVHFSLFPPSISPPFDFNTLESPPLAFRLEPNGIIASTLGFEETLWYLCLHLSAIHPLYGQSRLIWMADIVGFAERFADEIDWERIRKRYPLVPKMLSLLHFTIPLSASVREKAGIPRGLEPRGLGQDFKGQIRPPQSSGQETRSIFRRLRDTFVPSEWWLRLHYGLGAEKSIAWTRWIRHPLHLARLAFRLFVKYLQRI